MPRPEAVFRTSAIIIRRYEYGEADRLLTLFTPDQGKIRVIAKGVRKPTAKMAGHLELYSKVNLLVRRGRDLHRIEQAEQVQPYQPQRESLIWFGYAAYLVELLDRFSEDEEPNPPLFSLLDIALNWLSAPDADYALVSRYYELRLLRLTGFEPSLFRCAVGQEEIEAQSQYFSPLDGGVVCPDHVRGHAAIPLSLNALKILRYAQTRDFDKVRALQISPPMHQVLERIMHSYIAHLLETRLKSADFLHLIERFREAPQIPPSP